MKSRITLASLVLALLVPALAGAAPSTATDPMAIGADIGTTATGIAMGAVAVDLSVDMPLARSWAFDLEPSAYVASGPGAFVLQLTVEALARFYFMSLVVTEAERQAQWGPFLAGGAVVAWARAQGNSTLSAFSIGPELRAGYRLVFGDGGIYVEPTFGWMVLFGAQLGSGGLTTAITDGIRAGLTLGYRF